MSEIKEQLLFLRSHYGLFNVGVVPILTYGTVYARQNGLSAITVGCMWAIILIASVCLKITLSGIADKYRKRRLIFLATILLCSLSSFILAFISVSTGRHTVDILCHDQTYFNTCPRYIDTEEFINLRKNINNMTCQFSCSFQENFAREICLTWRKQNECLYDNRKTLYFNSLVEKKHLFLNNEHCIYGKIKKTIIENSTLIPYCNNVTRVDCSMKCDNTDLMDEIKPEDTMFLYNLKQPVTWVLLIIFLTYVCSLYLNFSLSDTICFDLLGEKAHLYGRQRLYGTIGFGTMTLFSGWMMDVYSYDKFTKNYKPMFLLASGILLLDLFVTSKMKIEQNVKASSVIQNVSIIFRSVNVTIFAFWTWLMGMFFTVCFQFTFWHLEDISTIDELGWIRTLQGCASLLGIILGEIPVFFLSGWIIQRLGHSRTMSLVLTCSALRFFFYSSLHRPIWILLIEILNGFLYGITLVVMASYSSLIALPGTESTVQAVFNAIFEGLGMASGSIIGGVIYNLYNGHVLFSLMCYAAVLSSIVHILVQFKLLTNPDILTDEPRRSRTVYRSPTEAISMMATISS